ncbi:hypothetical protein EYZ11_004888 [Aspergillus tanneri]|uniref:NAD(P)-binding domain-containing protein n=1 Tax=Aspergillus tanneri TaxID=1220188 RepID=A0A4S3JJD3_9EURO|nr:uncharacterized protein ATNIH1004_000527 [Aspergillus tanneri]KAA8651636.1 hypothetical protein ATNIH1004_000527 [Aspergillus tanneri]THC95626.1 hypothetical protein EYZ11_004888 [Aspergillus tanneri]
MQSIAFFGATGGCTLACLIPSLEAGHRCSALVRSPQKLKDLLPATLASAANLRIIQGSIADAPAVQDTLSTPEGYLVDLIVCGIGGQIRFDNPLRPTLDNPHICQEAMRAILDATRTVGARTATPSDRKPHLVVVSTTGISRTRDIPLAMIPLYHWLLKVPHEDKKVMETLVRQETEKDDPDRAISDYTIVRPSLLTDGEQQGVEKLRVGDDSHPAVGYVISRADVGGWMFASLVQERRYRGVVSLTS